MGVKKGMEARLRAAMKVLERGKLRDATPAQKRRLPAQKVRAKEWMCKLAKRYPGMLFRPCQAAALLGVSRQHVKQLMDAGKLPDVVMCGHSFGLIEAVVVLKLAKERGRRERRRRK